MHELRGAVDAFARLSARRGFVCLRHIFPFCFSLQPETKKSARGHARLTTMRLACSRRADSSFLVAGSLPMAEGSLRAAPKSLFRNTYRSTEPNHTTSLLVWNFRRRTWEIRHKPATQQGRWRRSRNVNESRFAARAQLARLTRRLSPITIVRKIGYLGYLVSRAQYGVLR